MRKEGIRRKTICIRKDPQEMKKETSIEAAQRITRVNTKIAVIQYLEDLIKKLRDEAVKEM